MSSRMSFYQERKKDKEKKDFNGLTHRQKVLLKGKHIKDPRRVGRPPIFRVFNTGVDRSKYKSDSKTAQCRAERAIQRMIKYRWLAVKYHPDILNWIKLLYQRKRIFRGFTFTTYIRAYEEARMKIYGRKKLTSHASKKQPKDAVIQEPKELNNAQMGKLLEIKKRLQAGEVMEQFTLLRTEKVKTNTTVRPVLELEDGFTICEYV